MGKTKSINLEPKTRQECIISLLLFAMVLEILVRTIKQEEKLEDTSREDALKTESCNIPGTVASYWLLRAQVHDK